MSDPYEEILEGEICLRLPPNARHEEICRRLHERISAALTGLTIARLLPLRSKIQLSRINAIRPDLALVTNAGDKLWLVAEVVSPEDHNPDTVIKKGIYEEMNLPRLWMVDPRYDNVEVYHGSPHGLALKQILAMQEVLSDPLLASFQYTIAELFRA